MSLPPSFGTQLAAIMDVLAKAAVAEITKLVDEGTVVFQLEMCRRDGEIEELKRSLQVMEIELCKAQDAVAEATITARISEDTHHEHAVIGRQIVVHNVDQEDPEASAMYMESKSVGSLFETGAHTEERRDLGPPVKCEPVDKIAAQETIVQLGITNSVASEIEKRDSPIWPSSHGMCEEASVEPDHAIQQCLQIFSSRGIDYHAQSGTVGSCDPLSSAGKVMCDAFGATIKVEPQMQPVCMEGSTSEPLRYVIHPTVNDHGLQPRLQQAGPSHMHRARESMFGSAHGEDHILRNRLKAKRPLNVWRAGINQKLFTCSVCGKGFPRFSQLEVHQFSHGAVKPFRCLECGKSFTQKTRLKTHQSVHTGERPFSCKICGKMFSRQDNCLRHERFHSGLKPYSCQQCGKSFTVLGNLKIHQEIHLRGR